MHLSNVLHLFELFGNRSSQHIIAAAEEFPLDCISNKSDAKTFDVLKYELYHSSSFKVWFWKITSNSS